VPTRNALIVASAAIFLAATAPSFCQSDLAQSLDQRYKDKTFILRGFYSGHNLKYDARGNALNPDPPDDWTVAGVVHVERIQVTGGRIKIEARRMHVGWPDGVFQEMHDQTGPYAPSEKTDRALKIEAELGATNPAAVDSVLAKIFLTSGDRFADLVPDYWKPCILAGLGRSEDRQWVGCRFSPEFSALPGVASADAQGQNSTSENRPPRSATFRMRKGAAPPKVISQTNPQFSQAARRAKYQGTTFLSVVVDKTGDVRDVQIEKPLGMGLDRKAVETVLSWHFSPAINDGVPADTTVNLEIDFRLY